MAVAASAASARERERQVLFGEHAVEAGNDLPCLHHHALFDQDFDHLAGDFRRDGGLAARHHITGRHEAARAACRGRDGGRRRGWRRGRGQRDRRRILPGTPQLGDQHGGGAASRPRSIASERSNLALSSAIRFTPLWE
jgi:hypothetical protein